MPKRKNLRTLRKKTNPKEVSPPAKKMGYKESYNAAREKIGKREPVWVPGTKVVFMPPNFLLWLGTNNPALCLMDPYCMSDLARYVACQRTKNPIVLATLEEINTHRDDLITSVGKIINDIPEPFQTRFSAAMLVIS